MRKLLTTLALISLAPACLAEELPSFPASDFGKAVLSRNQAVTGGVTYEAFIGQRNIEFLETYGPNSIFRQVGSAVGRLDVLTDAGTFPCTGFLIENNQVITNHHCVPGMVEDERTGATQIFAVQFRAGFLRDGIEGEDTVFFVNPAPLESSDALDYSVLQLQGDANGRFGALELSDALPEDRDPFWVIGHPDGRALQISREKCQAASPAINAGRVRHTCDTLPGSSGSPVIDAGLRQVVALHHAAAGGVNLAVPMRDILAQSRVLRVSAGTSSGSDGDVAAELAALRAELAAARAAQAKAERAAAARVAAAEAEAEANRAERDRLMSAAQQRAAAAETPTPTARQTAPVASTRRTTAEAQIPSFLVPKPGSDMPDPLPESQRGKLGVRVNSLDAETRAKLGYTADQGVWIDLVEDGSTGKHIGLRVNDVVLSYAGVTLNDPLHLVRLLAATPIGEHVALTVWRRGNERRVSFQMQRPKPTAPVQATFSFLGATLTEMDSVTRGRLLLAPGSDGLVVNAVANNSEAAQRGLRKDDVITEAGTAKLASFADLQARIAEAEAAGRKSLLILYRRDNAPRFLALSLK